MSVSIDLSGLNLGKIKAETTEELIRVTTQATGNLLNLSQRAAPKDRGENMQKHKMDIDVTNGEIKGRVEAYAPHAVYLHEGTGIYAKGGKGRKKPWAYTVLSGKYAGTHFTWGMKPRPWLDDTLADNRQKVISMFRGVVRK